MEQKSSRFRSFLDGKRFVVAFRVFRPGSLDELRSVPLVCGVHQEMNHHPFGAPELLPFVVDGIGSLVHSQATTFVFLAAAAVTKIVSADFHIRY